MTKLTHSTLAHSSMDFVRKKIFGETLSKKEIFSIISDIASHHYSTIELTAFVVSCSRQNLSEKEILYLTQAMIETGDCIDWELPMVLDKHCIGGIPGNRTTLIVVPIIAALGLHIPKTSSRAITSPAGTADTMESIANVCLTLDEMKKIVCEEQACIAWGGALSLAPVDDIIISVERPLSLDSEGQMVASILSKKKAAGSTHVLLDIPIGATAKVTSMKEAHRLRSIFEKVGKKIGLKLKVVFTDGAQPVGRGIGPLLEVQDVWQVLRNDPQAPQDLKEKSLFLAGELLELSGYVKNMKKGQGVKIAREILESGEALRKFEKIIAKQGAHKNHFPAKFEHDVLSPASGKIKSIHNKKIAYLARVAGAPKDMASGVLLFKKVGQPVRKGDVMFKIFSENKEELQRAVSYLKENPDTICVKVS